MEVFDQYAGIVKSRDAELAQSEKVIDLLKKAIAARDNLIVFQELEIKRLTAQLDGKR